MGFYCDPNYKPSGCGQVSLNAYVDDTCDGADYFELRLIVDECMYYQGDVWNRLECSYDTATLLEYNTEIGNCSDTNYFNSTTLEEGKFDGESAGCIEITGCSMATKPPINHSNAGVIVGYCIIALVGIAVIIISVVLFMRYRYQKKIGNIQSVNSDVNDMNDAGQGIIAATSQVHSGKMSLISTDDYDEPDEDKGDKNKTKKDGDDKTSGLLSEIGNE